MIIISSSYTYKLYVPASVLDESTVDYIVSLIIFNFLGILARALLDLKISRRFRARESNYASDEQSEAHVEIG